MACTKFIAQHSNTPYINHFIILVSHNDLGWNIIKCTTESRSLITRLKIYVRFACVNGPAEISQFYNIIHENDILRFKIPMDHTIFVEMHESADGLPDVVSSFSFREESFLSQDIK